MESRIFPEIIGKELLASNRTFDISEHLYIPNVRPYIYEAGYVTKFHTFDVLLNNISDAQVAVNSITIVGDTEGITCLLSVPTVIAPQGYIQAIFEIETVGPVVFEVDFQFNGDGLFNPVVKIVGTRSPELPTDTGYFFFEHNWESGFTEKLSWKTDVMISYDRTEQRMKLRNVPRKYWNLKYILDGHERLILETYMGLRRTRNVISPVWPNSNILNSPLLEGTDSVYLNIEGMDYRPGRYMAVWTDYKNYEVKIVEAVGDGVMIISPAFNRDWPIGTKIAPCRYGYINAERSIQRVTDNAATFDISFECLEELEYGYTPFDDIYKELPVLPFKLNFVDVNKSISNSWERLDNDIGIIEFEIKSIIPIEDREISILFDGILQIDLLYKFLQYAAGKLFPFWVSELDSSLRVITNIISGTSQIEIENIFYSYASFGDINKSHIEMILKDQTVIRANIINAIVTVDNTELLTLDFEFDRNIATSDISKISWFQKVRFGTDDFEIEFVTTDKAILKTNIVTLPK